MTDQTKYKCVIIDDEPLAIDVIKEHLAHFSDFEILATFTKGLDAIGFLSAEKVDLLFLDINMPGLSGIEFLKTIQNPPTVIFTTAYRNFAIDAFDLNALDYLLKPVSLERITKAITRFLAIQQTPVSSGTNNKQTDYIVLQSDKKNYKIPYNDILYIESLDNYIKVITVSQNLVCYQQLSALEKVLPRHFVRIHRSVIVNKDKITVFTSSYVRLGEKQFTIGRSYRDNVSGILG